MEMLHEDLLALGKDLAGTKILAKGEEYYFYGFYLTSERIPPVAEGYVLHIRLGLSAWRWEKFKMMDGTEAWHRAKYGFKPCDTSFIAEKTPPEMPINQSNDEVTK